jgi:hypothetical protein
MNCILREELIKIKMCLCANEIHIVIQNDKKTECQLHGNFILYMYVTDIQSGKWRNFKVCINIILF